jgi:hypothetical protein
MTIRLDNAMLRRFRRMYREQANGCWMWTGNGDDDGYGYTIPFPGSRRWMAHVWSLTVHKGEAPEGMTAGHVCHDRAVEAGTCDGGYDCPHRRCVNPAHLEWQTPSEQSLAQKHYERNVTHCPKGHPYEGDNLYVDPKGKRRCRACKRASRAS